MKTAEDILRRLVAVREQQGLPALLRALGDVEQEAEEFLQRQSNYVDLVARGLGADACESLIDEQVKQAGFPEGTKGMHPAAYNVCMRVAIAALSQKCDDCSLRSPHQPATAGGEPEIHAALRAAGLMLVRTQNRLRVEKAVDIVAGARAVVQKAVEQPGVPVEIPVPLSAAIKDHIKTSLAASDHSDGEKGPRVAFVDHSEAVEAFIKRFGGKWDKVSAVDVSLHWQEVVQIMAAIADSAKPAGEPSIPTNARISAIAARHFTNWPKFPDEVFSFARELIESLASAPAPAGDDSLRDALSGLLEFCAEHNANQGDPATDDPRVTAAIVATRVKPEPMSVGEMRAMIASIEPVGD